MGTTLLDLKLDRAFGHLDVNRNGHIDHDDVVALTERLVKGFHEEPDGARGKALADGFEEFWQSLVAAVDADGDQRLTPEEWNEGMVKAFVEPEAGFDRHMRPAFEAVVRLADTDGDGSIGYAEFQTMQKAFGTRERDTREAFDHLDGDGSGALSVDELIEAARQYYTGKGSKAGDWLFGKIA
jgi:Ca2+-binding EF-hand superfamily protein